MDIPLSSAIASKEPPFADIRKAPRIFSSKGTPRTPTQSVTQSPNFLPFNPIQSCQCKIRLPTQVYVAVYEDLGYLRR